MDKKVSLGKEQKTIQLPSGLKAVVKYIPHGLFSEICTKLEIIPADEREELFS